MWQAGAPALLEGKASLHGARDRPRLHCRPCGVTVRSQVLHPLIDTGALHDAQGCFQVWLSTLSRTPGSWPPPIMTSKHPKHESGFVLCQTHMWCVGPCVCLDCLRPWKQMDHGSLESTGRTFPGRKPGPLGSPGRRGPHLGVQKWSVTLIHCATQPPWRMASQDPQAAANLKVPAGHRTEDALAPCPPWLVRSGPQHLRPVGRVHECLFKERQAASHDEICHCPSVAQIKKIYFLPLPRISLTAVQWPHLPLGGGGD